ncbi:MAG: hypothetical protein Q8K75_06080 [Chlamydiales bacterium]|nr:hypothetical protein [Chlamydiales bacterium]
MRVRLYSFLLAVLALGLSSCSGGYHLGQGEAPWLGSTVSIPYVTCDTTGEVTRALIREVATSGAFEYVDGMGSYQLCVNLRDYNEQNIGFRYDVDKNGALTRTVIPVESRSRAIAEFSLIESCSGEVVLGPERVSASVEYDHEYNSGSDSLTSFSVGQVSDIEAAREQAPRQLGEVLAERIVDYIRSAW